MFNHFHCHIRLYAAALLLFIYLLMTGCGGGGTEVGNPETTSAMATFSSEAELEVYLKEQYATSVLPNNAYDTPAIQRPAGSGDIIASSSNELDGDFSQTNIQEIGVDESDTVKTDGTYMAVAGEQVVTIVKAAPADTMHVVNTIDVDGKVDSLYLYNDILVVLYTPDNGHGTLCDCTDLTGIARVGMPYWIPVAAQTGVLLVDVTDPSAPSPIEAVEADGALVSSRFTNGRLHVVQQFLPDLPPLALRYDGNEKARLESIAANRKALSPLTLDELVPLYVSMDAQGAPIESGRLVAPEDFYHPVAPGGGSIATVMTFDLDDPLQPFQSTGVVADAHDIYASTQALYLFATVWNDFPQTAEGYDYRLETAIHKFDIAGQTVRWVGSGKVNGRTLNQFSFGEYADVLRIATTTRQNGVNNHVFCVEAGDGKLAVIGRLDNLAPGEDIYAARFIKTRGYLVTFVKVDPLFTLDLSDPTHPTVVGELKVPGYSDYIHPLGEDHLITLGKDTMEQGGTTWYQGVQLSIFDISDFANPDLLHKEIIGDRGTHSEALYNHKAFTFWPENSLLAIPIHLYEHVTEPDRASKWGTDTFTGLYVYRVNVADGFKFLGRISTVQPYHGNDWTRGVFIDADVYAVQALAVHSARVANIAETIHTLSLVE